MKQAASSNQRPATIRRAASTVSVSPDFHDPASGGLQTHHLAVLNWWSNTQARDLRCRMSCIRRRRNSKFRRLSASPVPTVVKLADTLDLGSSAASA